MRSFQARAFAWLSARKLSLFLRGGGGGGGGGIGRMLTEFSGQTHKGRKSQSVVVNWIMSQTQDVLIV